MPSFRDLKGKPVEEMVDSRVMPGMPDPGEQMVEREAVKQAVERITAGRTRGRFTDPDNRISQEPAVVADAWAGPQSVPVALPEDMALALVNLEATVEVVLEHARAALAAAAQVMAGADAIRARAEKDAAKLAKLSQMLKALEE